MTQVVILAAGRGSRLGGLTEAMPKCLVHLAGRPLIAWQLAALAAGGLERVTLVTGYKAEALAALGLPMVHNPRWAETNMVASLLCAGEALGSEDDLIVGYGDIVYEPGIVKALLEAPGEIATVIDLDWLSLWRIRSDDPLSDAESLALNPDGTIRDIGRKVARLEEIEGQYIGLTKFTAKGKRALLDLVARAADWPLPRPLDEAHFTDLLQGLIAAGWPVRAVPVEGGWLEVDTPGDLAAYEARRAAGALDALYTPPESAA